MSKSLEALDKLCDLATQDGDCLNYVIGLTMTIKQDLERLELIETFYNKSLKELETIKNVDRELYLKYQAFINEKEQLKNDIKLNETQIDDLTLEVANYKHALEEKNEIIMDLKDLGVKIGREKYQLDKAIEILKDILNLNVTQDKHNNYFLDGDIITEITKEQYELLKEVL